MPRAPNRHEKGRHVLHRTLDVFVFLANRRHVVKRALGGQQAGGAGDDPCGQVLRGQTATGRRDVAGGMEWLIQDLHAGLQHPRLGRQIGARRRVTKQAEFGQQQGARALRADELAHRVQLQCLAVPP
jgi:hypothetical protein